MRGRIACLNTDLSATMKSIETGLAELHGMHRSDGNVEESSKSGTDHTMEENKINITSISSLDTI